MSERQTDRIEIFGRELTCLVCGHDQFWRREAQLNTATATFFDLDWANKSVTCVICNACGYIHWFYTQ
jgi:predicted nucleic-acid-binding Zn-ribbon protein